MDKARFNFKFKLNGLNNKALKYEIEHIYLKT